MRPRDLDLESQGQGHTKVTRVKKLQNLRFSPDCEHAECGAIGRTIAIFKFSTGPLIQPRKKSHLLRIAPPPLGAILQNLILKYLKTLRTFLSLHFF